jgi:hypothetical protein
VILEFDVVAQYQLLRLSRAKLLDYFFTPKTPSFAALATRNLTTVLAGILIFCCALGLKPVRAFLFCLTSLPKPGKTNSPFFLISLYAIAPRVSRNTPAVFLSVWVASASALPGKRRSLEFGLGHFVVVVMPEAGDPRH